MHGLITSITLNTLFSQARSNATPLFLFFSHHKTERLFNFSYFPRFMADDPVKSHSTPPRKEREEISQIEYTPTGPRRATDDRNADPFSLPRHSRPPSRTNSRVSSRSPSPTPLGGGRKSVRTLTTQDTAPYSKTKNAAPPSPRCPLSANTPTPN